MPTSQILGLVCLAYCAVTLLIVAFRPPVIWKISKIQGFVSLLGENGARVFIGVWGVVVGVPGVYLLLAY